MGRAQEALAAMMRPPLFEEAGMVALGGAYRLIEASRCFRKAPELNRKSSATFKSPI